MIKRKIIRMPKFYDSSTNLKYFDPQFIKIRRGETIEWLNAYKYLTNLMSIFGQDINKQRNMILFRV